MHITLSPQRRDDSIAVTKAGDVLTINDTAYDFSSVTEGAKIPAETFNCKFVVGLVERVSGDLQLTLILPNGANASERARFPQPIIDPADGALELPQ